MSALETPEPRFHQSCPTTAEKPCSSAFVLTTGALAFVKKAKPAPEAPGLSRDVAADLLEGDRTRAAD
jgi:hypothetical protein